jgi:dimethylamine/trimethylamine dehydrogenase
MGEEWRKGWHPERVPARTSEDTFLIVGAGPAGLECARVLGQRGYAVHVTESRLQVGGRVALEATLPGLAAWMRVRDYRAAQIARLPTVAVYRGSPATADDILGFGATRVVLATGARWRRDGVGRANPSPIPGFEDATNVVLTPDDVLAGATGPDPILVFDDDHYYLGAVLAEKLHAAGHEVVLVTPADRVSAWTVNTLEQYAIQKRLLELGIGVTLGRNLRAFDRRRAVLACVYTSRETSVEAGSIVAVTSRLPDDQLHAQLARLPDRVAAAGIESITPIGDCLAPGTIAAAVYGGHRHAREFDLQAAGPLPFRRELPT